jgi:hypothetical protein
MLPRTSAPPEAHAPARSFPLTWLGMAGLAALFLLLRWNNFNAPLIRDEGEYAYCAQLLEHGGVPYRDAFIQKPPMVIYSYGLADLLAPGTFWSPRIVAALCAALATALIGFVASRELGRRAAFPAMWLATPMILLPGLDQFTANTEMFLLLPLLGVVAVYANARTREPRLRDWFAAGSLASAALLYKYTVLPIIVFVVAVWIFETWRSGRKLWPVVRCLAGLVTGGALAAALALGYFVWHHSFAALWDCTVTFNRNYLASDNFGWAGSRFREFFASWWILFLLALAAFWRPLPRTWFLAGAVVAATVATGGSYYGQYYILLMPFWALLSVAGIDRLGELIARASTLKANQIKTGLIAFAVILVLVPDASWISLPPQTFAAAKFARRSVFLESPIVGERVARLTSPRDSVWVAASEPQILVYARRPSATRFITVYSLVIASPERQPYQDSAISEIESARPSLIVWARSWLQEEPTPSRYLKFLNETLARDFQPVGGYVLAGEKSQWVEPISPADLPAASIVLFKRKPAATE